ncbi:MAG: excisionase family DNA-binding protein [bacterium]|nr:excisionase family DNA-binding protein [bacterium]MCM1373953.1 excisionase family DNA-binding protein [Muribaculum sp.]
MNKVPVKVPVWEKYTLTITEAAEYFHIGDDKLRRIIKDNMDANYILTNGNRVQIKRKLFEEFIDKTSSI